MRVTTWNPLAAEPNAGIEALAQSIIADAQNRLCGDASRFEGANKSFRADEQKAKLTLIETQQEETTTIL